MDSEKFVKLKLKLPVTELLTKMRNANVLEPPDTLASSRRLIPTDVT